ncbi:MAG: response regulator, partial [Proteobacteria bacterium]
TAQRIRLRAENDRIPVIALSSLVSDGHWDECIKAGKDDVLAKPLQPESLRKLFKKFFKVDLSWSAAMLEKLAGLDFVSDKVLTDLAAKDQFKAPSLDRVIDSYISTSSSVVQGLMVSIRNEDVLSIIDFSRRLKILAQDIGSIRLTVLLQAIHESLAEANMDHSEFWIERIQYEQNSLVDCLLRSWHSEIKIVHKPRLAVS